MPPKSKYPSSAAGVGVPTLMTRTKTQKVSLHADLLMRRRRLLLRVARCTLGSAFWFRLWLWFVIRAAVIITLT